MIHANTIKSEVKKTFNDVKVTSIDRLKFGVFVIKVAKQMKTFIKHGIVIGQTDFDAKENGVVLDEKISWS